MKILFFSAFYYPHVGGQEKFVQKLSESLVQNKHSVDIITNNTNQVSSMENLNGVTIYRVKCANLLDGRFPIPIITDFYRVVSKIRKTKYDLIVTNTRFFPLSLLGNLWARKNKFRVLHIEHGTRHVVTSSNFTNFIGELYDHIVGRYIFSCSHHVAAVSKAAQQFVQHIKDREIVYLPNCTDTSYFRQVKSSLRSQFKIRRNNLVVTYVGRLTYAKGVQDLLLALKNEPHISMIIVGKGEYEQELQKISKQAIFVGEKKEDEVREILSITDIFVNPSYSEGLPTSVLEAGSMKIPVIATDVGGTKEILTGRCRDLLIQPQNPKKIRRTVQKLRQAKVREEYGKELQRKIQTQFSWDTANKILGDILQHGNISH
ncbi:glycosyltransferase [Candidatus Dojkabacteria bacterium]|nr:glycosyltransferase [Candidatus Dojkabacteria bacterium]